MNHQALGYQTQPLRVGAPLPEDMLDIQAADPEPPDIQAELLRARVELMYALAKHRKCWARMRAYHQDQERQADSKGVQAYLDSDATWKVITGDVRWWREEMQAQATAVQALTVMLPLPRFDPPPPPERGSVREVALSWDGHTQPTIWQYRAAVAWMDATGATTESRGHMVLDDWRVARGIAIRPPCICNTPPPEVDKPKNGTASRPPGWTCPKHGAVL